MEHRCRRRDAQNKTSLVTVPRIDPRTVLCKRSDWEKPTDILRPPQKRYRRTCPASGCHPQQRYHLDVPRTYRWNESQPFAKYLFGHRGVKVAAAAAIDTDFSDADSVAGNVTHVPNCLVQNIEPVVIQERSLVCDNLVRKLFKSADFLYPNLFPISRSVDLRTIMKIVSIPVDCQAQLLTELLEKRLGTKLSTPFRRSLF